MQGAERPDSLLGCLLRQTFVDLVRGEHHLRRGCPNRGPAGSKQPDSYMTTAPLIVERDDGAGAAECEVALAPCELDESLPAPSRR
jgi:hypothetical protein